MRQLRNQTSWHSRDFTDQVVRLSDIEWIVYKQEHASPVDDIFAHQLIDIRKCCTCNQISTSVQPFRVLPVAIDSIASQYLSLDQCLSRLKRTEKLSDLKCENCAVQTIKSMVQECSPTATIAEFERFNLLRIMSDCIVVQLLRFHNDSVFGARKILTPVKFYLHGLNLNSLSLDNFVEGAVDNIFNLCSFCVHLGSESCNSGHYVVYARHGAKWWKMDDSRVDEIACIDDVLASKEVRSNVYMLMFEKCSIVPAESEKTSSHTESLASDVGPAASSIPSSHTESLASDVGPAASSIPSSHTDSLASDVGPAANFITCTSNDSLLDIGKYIEQESPSDDIRYKLLKSCWKPDLKYDFPIVYEGKQRTR